MAPEPLLVFPDPPPPLLAQTLDLAGYPWKAVTNASVATQSEPADGWAGAVVCADEDPEGAFGICRALRKRDSTLEPVLLLVSGAQLAELEMREDLFDDFCLAPFHQKELEARLRHLFWRTGRGARPEIVEYGDLVLNLETYQAALSGRPLDLTYMEYELLKFFATHSSKVFTREQLLSRVWGYEYYGGARTVDVHVRRLRAKLGEEHASLIQTVRSVGYRFGSPRWAPGGYDERSGLVVRPLRGGVGPRSASSTSSQPISALQIAPPSITAMGRSEQHDDGDDDASGDHEPSVGHGAAELQRRSACAARDRAGGERFRTRALGVADRVPRRRRHRREHRVGRARDARPGSSTMSTSIGGVSFARRIPNERMVRSWTSPVVGIDREALGEHPAERHVRGADRVRTEHDWSSGSPAAIRTCTRATRPDSSHTTRHRRARRWRRRRTSRATHCPGTGAGRQRQPIDAGHVQARLRPARRARPTRPHARLTTSAGPGTAVVDHSGTSLSA